MRLFTYIVTHDRGLAPNPFHGICTLACCKPKIRETAQVGDWVVGLTPRVDGNGIVYAMRVTEKLQFKDYWRDSRFECKRPDMDSERAVDRRGDNFYQLAREQSGCKYSYKQHEALHREKEKERDLSSHWVLLSDDFRYFGSQPVDLNGIDYLIVGRGHRCNFEEWQLAEAIPYIKSLPRGVHAAPSMKWPEDDMSCAETGGMADI